MPGHGTSSRILFALSLALGALAARAAEDFSTWAHSAKLHLNTTASGSDLRKTITDFPLLVRITDSRILSQSQADGSDLRFASESGAPLDFQIERWAPGQGKGEVWVRMPRVDSLSDKQSVMVYWGKSGAAWLSNGNKVFLKSAGYRAVYHLGEGGTQSRINAVGNWNHAAPKNYDGDERVEGVIGMADNLDGAGMGGDYLDLGTGFDSLSSLTFTVWADPARMGFADQLLDIGNGEFTDELAFGRAYQTDSLSAMFYSGSGWGGGFGGFGFGGPQEVSVAHALETGKWNLYGLTVNGKTVTLFKNGAQLANGTLGQSMTIVTRMTNFIGHSHQGWDDFAGKLDEPEFSFTNHSPEWMKLVYESQRPDPKMYAWEFPAEIRLSITTHPAGLTVGEGDPFVLSVAAAGSGVIGYQWLKDGSPLPGAVSQDLRIASARLSDAGAYACRLTDGQDTVLSKAAAVSVSEDLSTWAHARGISADPRNAGVTLSADAGPIPVLIRLGRGDFDFAQAAADGSDLRFAASDGSALAFAIERWTADTAEIWVRLPSVPASGNASVTLYWGKSGARPASSPASVFSAADEWRAYYALSESPAGTGTAQAGDATANGYAATGTAVSGVAQAAIGRGVGFAGTPASHAQAPAAILDGRRAFTILAWVREKTAGSGGGAPIQDPQVIGTGLGGGFGFEQFGLGSKNGILEAWIAGSATVPYVSGTGAVKLNNGSWHLIAVSASGTDFDVYADGKAEFSLTGPDLPVASLVLGIGGVRGMDGSWSAGFNGDIDAVQILGEAKGADWIKLAYAAQRPGSSLIAFQAPVDQAPPAPAIAPPGGEFEGPVAVTLSGLGDSVRIFYTLDGSDPDTSARGSTRLYDGGFALSGDAEVRALAYRKGMASAPAHALFRVAALRAGGDTLRPGGSQPLDAWRRLTYPNQDAQSPVLVLPGPAWNPPPAGFDRVGRLFRVLPIDSTALFPGLAVEGDSLEGLSLFRREADSLILWVPPKDGLLWVPAAGTYFWGRDIQPPRVRLAGGSAQGNDSMRVRIRVDDNTGVVRAKIRFGRTAPDSIGWWGAPSGDTLEFIVPVPADPAVPLEAVFSATDQSSETRFPPQGYLTLPRPLPAVAAPIALPGGLRWKMAGMPMAPGLPLSLRELAARSGTGPVFAAVWREGPAPDSGYRILSGDDTLPGGKGFWIASDGKAPGLDFPPGMALGSDSDGLFPIRLERGWNLITCPSLRPVAWPVSVRDGEAYLRSPLKPVFAFNDTGYARPDSLQPWRAYYVHYAKDTVVRVGAGAPRAADRFPAKAAAGAGLGLEIDAGGMRLALGASPSAGSGLGREDEAQPPRFSERSAAWLAREGKALSADYVAWDPGRAMAWTLALRAQPEGSGLKVASAALPPGFGIWAVSPSRRLKWPLGPGGNIPVTGDDTLLIFAGTPEALSRVPELALGREAAGAFAAGLRPAAGGLELVLDLPAPGTVSARLVDARGAILGGLSRRPLSPGRHAFAWASLARAPEALPPGVYWLDLRASGPGWEYHRILPTGFLR